MGGRPYWGVWRGSDPEDAMSIEVESETDAGEEGVEPGISAKAFPMASSDMTEPPRLQMVALRRDTSYPFAFKVLNLGTNSRRLIRSWGVKSSLMYTLPKEGWSRSAELFSVNRRFVWIELKTTLIGRGRDLRSCVMGGEPGEAPFLGLDGDL